MSLLLEISQVATMVQKKRLLFTSHNVDIIVDSWLWAVPIFQLDDFTGRSNWLLNLISKCSNPELMVVVVCPRILSRIAFIGIGGWKK